MRLQTVEFLETTATRIPFEKRDKFQLRSDRPALWLQKCCFYILRKLGAFSLEETITIERHTIDAQTFMERIFKQQEGIEQLFNLKPTKLLIGAADYAELMNETAATRMFSFFAEYGFSRERLGLTVQVVPWMRGCLVMPSDADCIRARKV